MGRISSWQNLYIKGGHFARAALLVLSALRGSAEARVDIAAWISARPLWTLRASRQTITRMNKVYAVSMASLDATACDEQSNHDVSKTMIPMLKRKTG